MASVTGRVGTTAERLRGALRRMGTARRPAVSAATCWGSSATTAACYAAARIGLEFAYPHNGDEHLHGSFTAFWPPIGVGIAALVLFGPRLWPGVVAGDLLAGDYSAPFPVVGRADAGTVIAVVVASALLLRLGARTPGPARQGRDHPDRLLGGRHDRSARPAACSRSGSSATSPPGASSSIWRTWWLSDLAGALVVTPALLTWSAAHWRPTRQEISRALADRRAGGADEHLVAARRAVRRVPGPGLGGPPLRAAAGGAASLLIRRVDGLAHLRTARGRSSAAR